MGGPHAGWNRLRAALAILLLAGCSNPATLAEYPTTLRCPECRALAVTRVIDGDTLDTPDGRIRMFGIDAPERGTDCFARATGALRLLAGKAVKVEPGPRERDRGSRLLFYLYTEAGNSIDEILVREGLAVAWKKDGQHRDLLAGLEAQARAGRAGCLWSRETRNGAS